MYIGCLGPLRPIMSGQHVKKTHGNYHYNILFINHYFTPIVQILLLYLQFSLGCNVMPCTALQYCSLALHHPWLKQTDCLCVEPRYNILDTFSFDSKMKSNHIFSVKIKICPLIYTCHHQTPCSFIRGSEH